MKLIFLIIILDIIYLYKFYIRHFTQVNIYIDYLLLLSNNAVKFTNDV